jgi:1,4-alpha-glucan branching enzyme
MPTTIERSARTPKMAAVTFRLPKAVDAREAAVVGEFNDWSTSATPMVETDDGFAVTVELEVGRRYRFRYLLDGNRWENDWAADAYVGNEFGGDDSVVDVRDARDVRGVQDVRDVTDIRDVTASELHRQRIGRPVDTEEGSGPSVSDFTTGEPP